MQQVSKLKKKTYTTAWWKVYSIYRFFHTLKKCRLRESVEDVIGSNPGLKFPIFLWVFMQLAPSYAQVTCIQPDSGIHDQLLLKMHHWCTQSVRRPLARQAKVGTRWVFSQAAHRLGLSGLNGSEWGLNGELVGIWLGALGRYGRPHLTARTCWDTDRPL